MIGKNQTSIHCAGQIRSQLREAIQSYSNYLMINLQESRDLTPEPIKCLLDIERQLAHTDRVEITTDMVTCKLIKSAIHYHYRRIEKLLQVDLSQQRRLMLKIIHGDQLDDSQLDQTLADDRVI